MHAFDVLGDPVRRRLLELLAAVSTRPAEMVTAISAEFGISQPAVSQHLKVLREAGFATVRVQGARRLYAVNAGPAARGRRLAGTVPPFWEVRLDALATELARGRRARRTTRTSTEEP